MTATTLYRLYDAGGTLLYVGISGRWSRRMGQHAAGKPWWGEVAQVRLETLPSREEALAAEDIAIRGERPRYNGAQLPKPTQVVPTPTPYVCAAADDFTLPPGFRRQWLGSPEARIEDM